MKRLVLAQALWFGVAASLSAQDSGASPHEARNSQVLLEDTSLSSSSTALTDEVFLSYHEAEGSHLQGGEIQLNDTELILVIGGTIAFLILVAIVL